MPQRKDIFGSRRDFDPDQDEFYGIRDDGDERWLTYRKLILSRLQDLKEAYESLRGAIEELRRVLDQKSTDQTQINADVKNSIQNILTKIDTEITRLKDADTSIDSKIEGHMKSTDAEAVLKESKSFTIKMLVITALLGFLSTVGVEVLKGLLAK